MFCCLIIQQHVSPESPSSFLRQIFFDETKFFFSSCRHSVELLSLNKNFFIFFTIFLFLSKNLGQLLNDEISAINISGYHRKLRLPQM